MEAAQLPLSLEVAHCLFARWSRLRQSVSHRKGTPKTKRPAPGRGAGRCIWPQRLGGGSRWACMTGYARGERRIAVC